MSDGKASPKLLSLPGTGVCNNNADIARNLRALADSIENDDEPVATVAMVVEYSGMQPEVRVFGRHCDLARLVGLMMVATIRESIY